MNARTMTDDPSLNARRSHLRRKSGIPIPREHGGWVILYGSLLLGALSVTSPDWTPAFLMLLAATGLYLSRFAFHQAVRKRSVESVTWLFGYLALSAASGLPLIFHYRLYSLLWIGAGALFAYAFLVAFLFTASRKRIDRTAFGEIVGVCALTLSAPAARIAAGGAPDAANLYLWGVCSLYFAGGILYVKMFIAAAKTKGEFTSMNRWKAARWQVLYHLGSLAALVALFISHETAKNALLLLAFAPALARAFHGGLYLRNHLPPMKRMGLLESAYATWFLLILGLIMRR